MEKPKSFLAQLRSLDLGCLCPENICKGQLITDGLFHPPLPPNHSLSHWQNYRGIFTSIITSNYASIVNADTIHWKVNINAGICLWCQICHRFHNGSQVTNVTLSGRFQFCLLPINAKNYVNLYWKIPSVCLMSLSSFLFRLEPQDWHFLDHTWSMFMDIRAPIILWNWKNKKTTNLVSVSIYCL